MSATDASGVWVELRPDATLDDRVVATVLRDGAPAGRAVYALFPSMVVLYELVVDDGPSAASTETAVVGLLLARFEEPDPPAHFIHVGVRHPRLLRHYATTSLAPGMVVTGTLGGAMVYHDRLATLTEDALRRAEEAGENDPTGVVVAYARGLEALAAPDTLTEADMVGLLRAETALARIGALRAIAMDARFADDFRDQAYMFALLDPSYEVRRFASVGVVGFFPGAPYHPAWPVLRAHLADPLQSFARLGVEPVPPVDQPAYDAAHGRRNKRFGILWVLGGLAGLAPPRPEVEAWRARWLPEIAAILTDEGQAHDEAADAALWTCAQADVLGDAPAYTVGVADEMGLFALLRYAVLRHHLVAAGPDPDQDRFYWLMEMVDYLVPSPLSPTAGWEGEVEARLHVQRLFAAPPGPVPSRGELPPWLHGRWSPAAVALVPTPPA